MLKGAGGTSRPDRDWLPRLITVCRAHHEWAHDRERLLAEQAGIIVRRGAYLARLDEIPVRYALSPTRWALLGADGHAVPCPPPDLTEEYAALCSPSSCPTWPASSSAFFSSPSLSAV